MASGPFDIICGNPVCRARVPKSHSTPCLWCGWNYCNDCIEQHEASCDEKPEVEIEST